MADNSHTEELPEFSSRSSFVSRFLFPKTSLRYRHASIPQSHRASGVIDRCRMREFREPNQPRSPPRSSAGSLDSLRLGPAPIIPSVSVSWPRAPSLDKEIQGLRISQATPTCSIMLTSLLRLPRTLSELNCSHASSEPDASAPPHVRL